MSDYRIFFTEGIKEKVIFIECMADFIVLKLFENISSYGEKNCINVLLTPEVAEEIAAELKRQAKEIKNKKEKP